MTAAELEMLFDELTDEEFVDSQVFRAVPWILRARPGEYDAWRLQLAATAGIPQESIRLIGSASLGFSLKPATLGREFRDLSSRRPSDIDLAIVSEPHFVAAWETILSYDRKGQFYMVGQSRYEIAVSVYNGHLAQAAVPKGTDASRTLGNIST